MTAQDSSVVNDSDSPKVMFLAVIATAAAFIVFGFIVDGPARVFSGLLEIISTRDALLTDYFGAGGIGAGCVNAGLLTLMACTVYRISGAKIGGAAIASLFLVLGFGLFGKNIFNVWFIVAGVFAYSLFKGERFEAHINTAFFGAALAPIFSEILFSTSALPMAVKVPLAVFTALAIGFVLVPIAAHLFKTHMGFSLYNMGFTAGVVGTVVVAIYRSYGFVPNPVMIWTTGHNLLLGIFLMVIFAAMILAGLWRGHSVLSQWKALMRQPGQAPSDFLSEYGAGPTLINMGVTGTIGMAYILIVGGDLNGPTIGAIFTIVGFSAYGKHPLNIVPIMAGVFLGSFAKPWNAHDPSLQLAALFATTLAPIAGRFGWYWGVVAGLIHSSVALTVGYVHAGLNLYNNGFAAGIVAAVLVPVILAVQIIKKPS